MTATRLDRRPERRGIGVIVHRPATGFRSAAVRPSDFFVLSGPSELPTVEAPAASRATVARSPEFRTHWAAHNVRFHRTGTKRLCHPLVGDLQLSYKRRWSSRPTAA